MAGYGGNFLTAPGSLEGSYDRGRDNFEDRGKYNSDMATANLERILAQQRGEREQDMHPLNMENKQLTNTGLGLGNQKATQDIGIGAEKEKRDQEEHQWKQATEVAKSYGQIAAELEGVPEGARMDFINARLGSSTAGRNIHRGITEGLKNGTITRAQLPQVFKDMNKRIVESSAAYQQAQMTQRETTTRAAEKAIADKDRQVELANIRTGAAAQLGSDRLAQQAAALNQKQAYDTKKREEEHARNMEKERLRADSRMKVAEAKAKTEGKSATGKDFQNLSKALLEQSMSEDDPDKKAALRQQADDAFNYAVALKSSGPGSDTEIDTGDGKTRIKTKSRQNPAPAAPGNGATGGWGPIKRIQ